MTDTPLVRELSIYRRLTNGDRLLMGQLAQNTSGSYLQLANDYLTRCGNPSPYQLDSSNTLQRPTDGELHQIHGVVADSLPDGWGLLLMDRVFRQRGLIPERMTAMDRLAYMGNRCMGALEFEPDQGQTNAAEMIELQQLGNDAIRVYEGQTDEVLAALSQAGGSGGARPKAQIYLDNDWQTLNTCADPAGALEPWLIKFTSEGLGLGHDEGVCEAAYLQMAAQAGIDTPRSHLVESNTGPGWLALKRFDCLANGGRLHMHSACGLLNANFRLPSLDYETLIKAANQLCGSVTAGKAIFRRAMFNLFALNQDDHSKNWAFMQDDIGQWTPSPHYDVTYSPSTHGEHATAFSGYGKQPPVKAIVQLARQAGYRNLRDAEEVIQQVIEAINQWDSIAQANHVPNTRRLSISNALAQNIRENSALATLK